MEIDPGVACTSSIESREGRTEMTDDSLKIDEVKTAFNARAKASMRLYLKSKSWPEKITSIERMNEAAKIAREGMRRTRERGTGEHKLD